MIRPFLTIVSLVALLAPGLAAAAVDAVVQWSRRVELGVPVSGVIARVAVNPGQRVAKDELLLALDSAPFLAEVHEAEATVEARKVERDEAQRDHRHAQELYARTVLSTVELENAKMRFQRADAAWRAARAVLEQARYRLRVSAIRAPFDGVVLGRYAEEGQTVAAGLVPARLLVIAAADEYLAVARLSGERLAGIKIGQALSVSVAGRRYAGQVKSLGGEPPAGSKDELLALEVVFRMPDAPLRAGQPASIELP